MRVLGLDIGDRWIGAALSDPMGIIATPLTIIERKTDEGALAAILDIVKENEVGLVVAGVPYSMDGQAGEQAEKAKSFTEKLTQSLEVPVKCCDERLSTYEAQQKIKESGKKKKRPERDDAVAAAVILQSYLNEHPR